MVITMKNTSSKQKKFEEKERRRMKRIFRMKPEQQEKSARDLVNRSQRKNEIRERMIEMLQSTDGLSIVNIQKQLRISRSTLNYWLKLFEKEGWFKRKQIEKKQGRPTIITLNKRRMKEREQYSSKKWKNHTDFMLKSYCANEILNEIREGKTNQHERLVEVMDKFTEKSYGHRIILLLHRDDLIKINYSLELTEKGKKKFGKRKKKLKT